MAIGRIWTAPTFPDTGVTRRVALVQRLSLVLAAIAVVWGLTTLFAAPDLAGGRRLAFGTAAFLLGCVVVARRGQPDVAAWALVAGVWITGAISVGMRATLEAPGFGACLIAVLIAGVLVGGFAAVGVTVLTLVTSGIYLLVGMPALGGAAWPANSPAAAWFIDGAYTLAVGGLLWVGFAQLRQALRRAEASETRFALLAQRGIDIFWTMEGDGRITYVSPSVENVLGYTAEEQMSRRGTLGMLDADHIHFATDAIDDALRHGGGPFRYDARHVRKDGGSQWCEVTGVVIADENGKLAAVHGVTRDIQARKEAEDERDDLEMQLRQSQKMEAIGRLAGGIAHDFNNYLTVIQTRAESAREATSEAAVRDALADIRSAADHSADLVRQLLVLGRRAVMRPRTLDPNELVRGMETLLARVLGEDVELETSLAEDLACVRVDAPQLEQVLLNLAVNAREAMPRGGSLTITSENVSIEEGDPHAAGLGAGAYVKITVRDTGVGMDAEVRERIFEPFFTTKESERNSGLGLSTVYGIVQQCGGTLTVRSQPGQGTEFEVLLPAVREEADVPAERRRPTPVIDGAATTILIVEDLEMLRHATRALLERQGYTVLEAASGPEALELARGYEGPIHLLLTDLLMPRQSGLELARELRELRPGLSVLYMSGFSKAPDPAAQWELDAPMLEKPFLTADLLTKVQEALGREAAA